MTYTPREIKDRVAVGDDIFIVEDLGNNRIRLIPAPTYVSEPGTPINKALLQPIEDELGRLSATKVDKVPGKGLSTNDFTDALKNKLDGIEAGAQVNTVTSVAGKTGAVTLTKSDVGLGNVQNYEIATQAQAEAGTANNVYMTPLRVAQAIQQTIKTGQYTGDGSLNRTINVGFTPKAVLLFIPPPPSAGGSMILVYSHTADAVAFAMTDEAELTSIIARGLTITSNGFIVGKDLVGLVSLGNASGVPHFWIAFR